MVHEIYPGFHVFPKVNPMDIFMDIPADCLWILMFFQDPHGFFFAIAYRVTLQTKND